MNIFASFISSTKFPSILSTVRCEMYIYLYTSLSLLDTKRPCSIAVHVYSEKAYDIIEKSCICFFSVAYFYAPK